LLLAVNVSKLFSLTKFRYDYQKQILKTLGGEPSVDLSPLKRMLEQVLTGVFFVVLNSEGGPASELHILSALLQTSRNAKYVLELKMCDETLPGEHPSCQN